MQKENPFSAWKHKAKMQFSACRMDGHILLSFLGSWHWRLSYSVTWGRERLFFSAWCSPCKCFTLDAALSRISSAAWDNVKWCATFYGAKLWAAICPFTLGNRPDQSTLVSVRAGSDDTTPFIHRLPWSHVCLHPLLNALLRQQSSRAPHNLWIANLSEPRLLPHY